MVVNTSPAENIEEDVDAFAAGDSFDALAQVFMRVIDDFGRSVFAHDRRLFRRAHPGDDPRAQMPCQVDHREPDAARGPGDKNNFAGLKLRAYHQPIVGGAVTMPHGRAGNIVDRRRQARGPALRGGHLLSKGADPTAAGHAVSRLEARDACAYGRDDAGGVRARHKRRLRPHLVFSCDHEAVHETHRGCMDVDEDLTRGGLWVLRLSDFQRLEPGKGFANDGAHDQAPSLTRTATATAVAHSMPEWSTRQPMIVLRSPFSSTRARNSISPSMGTGLR